MSASAPNAKVGVQDRIKRVDAESANAVVDLKSDKKDPPGPDNDGQVKPNLAAAKAADKDQKTPADDAHQDDGLQADERSLQAELADEQKRKAEKDVVLNEAAHILSDEVGLIRNDTKIAARVLPHPAGLHAAVD
jgi:carboxyl-terminal processing protease